MSVATLCRAVLAARRETVLAPGAAFGAALFCRVDSNYTF
jgi:hypothetical protein